MPELKRRIGKGAVGYSFGIQPKRIFEIILAGLDRLGKKTFSISFEGPRRNSRRRLDQLVLRKRKRLVALVQDLIGDLPLHRLQVGNRVSQRDISCDAATIRQLFAEK